MILPGPGVQGASLGLMRRWSFHGWGRKRPPASFCGDLAGASEKGFFPADAARAHRPEPRATNRNSVKVKVGKTKYSLDFGRETC
ncbi:MAG: hypothetical protein HY882_06695 [Deltaproteobacteria bacterium]|nr:hypothetical protein [Deltaproteobacteria bacterium]